MAKVKKAFFCGNCGFESAKWMGKCTSCGEWNTFTEEILSKPTKQEEKSAAWKDSSTHKNRPKELASVITEESEEQIKMRADRIGIENQNSFIYAETNINTILKSAKQLQPDVLIIDSIQTISSPFLDSTPGSISQVRECTGELQRFAKETNIPVFVIV